jgi:glycosyltransferase involved in cell wall biosynthesis
MLSVALITHDAGPYLDLQLDSIARQTRLPDEIVIGDDRSSDGTLAVIERFAAGQGVPVHWERSPERLGASRNLERVIGRCRGDIVVLADQDDVWLPHKLARLEAALAAAPDAGGVFSDGLLIDAGGRHLPGTLFGWLGFGAAERARFRNGGALQELIKRNVVVGATLAVRRSALLRLVPFEPGWVHDYYLALALTALGGALVIDEPLIEYRRHPGQQVGIADARWATAVALARRQSAVRSRQEASQFERLGGHLAALGLAADDAMLRAFEGKARFLAQRAEMRARRRRAPGLMWRGLRDGGYRRYGAGYKQLLLDLLALGVGAGPAARVP